MNLEINLSQGLSQVQAVERTMILCAFRQQPSGHWRGILRGAAKVLGIQPCRLKDKIMGGRLFGVDNREM